MNFKKHVIDNRILFIIIIAFSYIHSDTPGGKKSDSDRPHEQGNPIIQNYSMEDIDEGNPDETGQVFAVTQDQRGVMYFGLNNNIAQFDGQHWKLIPVPSGSVRDLAVDRDGTVYVAMNGDMGYLAGDKNGNYVYVSLLDRIPESQRELKRIWSIHLDSHDIYFFSESKMYRYHENNIDVIEDAILGLGNTVYNLFYTKGRSTGIAVIREGRIHRIPYFDQSNMAKEFGRITILPWVNHQALIVTTKKGMYVHDLDGFIMSAEKQDKTAPVDSFLVPFNSEIESYIREHQVYCNAKISETQYAIGTLGGGIIIMNDKGRLVQVINVNRGLINDRIYSLFVDRSGNLWAGTSKGISHIAINSPVTRFDSGNGIQSALFTAIRYNHILYWGMLSGAYFFPPFQMTGQYDRFQARRIQDIKDHCMGMTIHKGMLIAAVGRNLVQIKGESSRLLTQMDDVIVAIAQTKRFPDYVFLGLLNGMAILDLAAVESMGNGQPSAWNRQTIKIIRNEALRNINATFYSIICDNKEDFWASSSNKGIFQIRWHGKGLDDLEIMQFGLEDGMPDLSHNTVAFAAGQVLIGTESGIFKFVDEPENPKKARIVPEVTFGRQFNESQVRITGIYEDLDKNLWIGTPDHFGMIIQNRDGDYFWDTKMTSIISGNISFFFPEEDKVIWFSTEKALYRYDEKKPKHHDTEYSAMICKVSSKNGRVLHKGEYFDPSSETKNYFTRTSVLQPADKHPVLVYADNTVSFEFGALFYEQSKKMKFQYKLDGFDKNWSRWGNSTTKEYTNLPENSYAFRVRARNIYEKESEEAVFHFSISPPWYRTWMAYLGFLLIGLGLLLSGVRGYTFRLHREKEKLEKLVTQRTQDLVDANRKLEQLSLTDPLTLLPNRRNFELIFAQEWKRCSREANPLSLLMLDIDFFKMYNDSYGHLLGDECLKKVATVIQRCTSRAGDFVARLGGEEFLVVLSNTPTSGATLMAERIRNAVEELKIPHLNSTIDTVVTISIGMATIIPELNMESDSLILAADQALYQAKKQGRNRIASIS